MVSIVAYGCSLNAPWKPNKCKEHLPQCDGHQGAQATPRIPRLHTQFPPQVFRKCKGRELVGKTYQPLFPYFMHLKAEAGGKAKTGAFRVVSDKYVTDSDGTGVVHQAPFFGEDDLRVCLAHGDTPPPFPFLERTICRSALRMIYHSVILWNSVMYWVGRRGRDEEKGGGGSVAHLQSVTCHFNYTP